MRKLLLLLLCLFSVLSIQAQTTRYVRQGGSGDGSSWENASSDLQGMINAAGTTQVWVAAGTYKPTTTTDRTISFHLKNGVTIYGGFPASGTPALSDRNWTTHVTTLSGDIGVENSASDNSLHVVRNNYGSVNNSAVLDGFTITAGRASPTGDYSVVDITGAGMLNYGASPTVRNCSFTGNQAAYGGGLFNWTSISSPVLINCRFYGNSASNNGGAIMNSYEGAAVTLINCSVSGNSAQISGGGIHGNNAVITLKNCIVWGNNGGAISSENGGSVTVTYSIVEGGYTGTGNLSANPLFIGSGNLRLQACSPAINTGTATGAPDTDLDGNPRPFPGTGVDMGAYEYQATSTSVTCYADTDGDGFGNAASSQVFCPTCPTGYVANNTDCKDDEALAFPGQTWYADLDGDGYSSGNTLAQCLRPTGYKAASELTATSGDCNDDPATGAPINPGATEGCDGVDNNCDEEIDENVLTTYYQDADGDSYGNPAMTQEACSRPTGYVDNSTDCNDEDELAFPGQTWYADLDGDGYSNGTTLTQCLRPAGYKAASELTATSGDCNDDPATGAAINPGATEVCDGVDNNCDEEIDEDLLVTYYQDADGDGYGNPTVTQEACSRPAGYADNSTDCNDEDELAFPGQTWYADLDNDGYGSGAILMQCPRPAGYKAASELTAATEDCDDNDPAINVVVTASCQTDITIQFGDGNSATLLAEALDNGSTGCGLLSFTINGAASLAFDCDEAGPQLVTLTVTDANGRSSTCETIVTVVDNTPPTLYCPANISAPYHPATCTEVNVPSPTVGDNCGVTELTWVMSGATTASSAATGINYVGTQPFNFGETTITYTARDAAGNSSTSCAFTVTVNPALTSSLITLSPASRQYSDEVTFTATIGGGAGNAGCTPQWQAAQSADFYVGTQFMGSADFQAVGTDLVATLEAVCLLESVNGQLAPGARTVSATFSGIDDVHFTVNQPATVNLEIGQEDATVAYNGQEYFSTPSPASCTGTVTLSAYVGDDQDAPDGCSGDIRNTRITFSNGGIPGTTLGASNLLVGLIHPDNLQEGIAVSDFSYTLTGNNCSSGGETFEVWVKAGHYYTGQTEEEEVTLVTLALPGQDFVNGGGHRVLSNSAGSYAGTDGSKMSFGFSMKWNTGGKNLQGKINLIFRRLVNGQWRTYQISSNKINSMAVDESSADYRKAIISTKANLQDITDRRNPVSLGGNLNLAMDVWEHAVDHSGSLDQIAVTLSGSGSQGLLFSSYWSGRKTAAQLITIGKIRVKSEAAGQSLAASPVSQPAGDGQADQQAPSALNFAAAADRGPDDLRIHSRPNPFTSQAEILVETAVAQPATLRVFDSMGRMVATLHDGPMAAGQHRFTFAAGNLPGGLYFYAFSTGAAITTGSMLLVR